MSQNAVKPYMERRERNLEFFRRNYPGVYQFFKDYRFQKLKLDIRPDEREVDLIQNQKRVYGGFGKKYAAKEAESFNRSFPPGKRVRSVDPIRSGQYIHPRFFAQHLAELYALSPLQHQSFEGYEVPGFLPMVVCLGVGLGLHVQELQKQRDIHHLIVVEPDPDRFAASLYTADWVKIVNRQREKPGRSFDLVLLHDVKDLQDVRAAVWNKLIEHCPIFPVNTFLYNHTANPDFNQVMKEVNKDIFVHLFSFGNYDDEINQLNNAIHNFIRPTLKAGKSGTLRLQDKGRAGVCIVGSGPSLDTRIDDLRSLSERAVVISCGTALGPLLKYGIVPDIHVELESDAVTARVQSKSADAEMLAKVRILGAAQLSPRLFELFGEKRLFFKAESPLSKLFADSDERITDAAPTCTNAGLALAGHYGFRHIFLFGLDYGFPDADHHHASGSVYYDSRSGAGVSSNLQRETIEVEAAAGGVIKSTPFLYASKRRTENVLISVAKGAKIHNLSDGAAIERADWQPGGDTTPLKESLDDLKGVFLDHVFGETPEVSRELIQDRVVSLYQFVSDLAERMSRMLKEPIRSLSDLTRICSRMNNHLQQKVLPLNTAYYYFTRGTIWHFLHAGYSHAFALPEPLRRTWMELWQSVFLRFLNDWPEHFRSVVEKDFEAPDPWIDRSIREPEKSDDLTRCRTLQSHAWRSTGFHFDPEQGYTRKARKPEERPVSIAEVD